MQPTIRVGFDPGNSESTLVSAGTRQRRVKTIPSYIGGGSRAELKRLRSGGGRTSSATSRSEPDDELALVIDGVEYFVGDLALTQGSEATTGRGDPGRYTDGHTLRLLLALLGAQINSKLGHVRVLVTTGLPVDLWTEAREAHVRRSLCGEHVFTLNGQERRFTVAGVFVMMEGSGALAHLGSAEDVIQGVVDIGGGSTDLFMAEGQEPLLPRCGSQNTGVERIGHLLRLAVEDRYDRTLKPSEIKSVLRAHVAGVAHPSIYAEVKGQRRQLTVNGELTAAIDAVGREVTTYIGQKWNVGGKIAPDAAGIYLVGGGGYFLRDLVKAKVGNVEMSERPEIDNALGYCDVCQAIPDEAWASLGV